MGNQTVLYFSSIIRNARILNKKEKEILQARLKRRTLHKIGKKYKLSGERIRQIENQALKRFLKKINQLLLFD